MATKKKKADDPNMISACGGQKIPNLIPPPKKPAAKKPAKKSAKK